LKFVSRLLLKAGSMLTSLGRILGSAQRVGRILGSAQRVGDDMSILFSHESFPIGVFFDAPTKGIYQLKMWLPTVEKLGVKFFIVAGRPALIPEIRKLTNRPVLLVPSDRVLDLANVPGLKTWLYVNNSKPNSDYVRFPQFTHVQLMHGDSEKTANYSPVNGMYTKIFVAGQAGIDRYKRNGVEITAEKFIKVGRPQLSPIEVGGKAGTVPTLLICPTWGGSAQGDLYTSLPVTPEIAECAVKSGVRVIYRPHPYSFRKKGDLEVIARVHALLARDNEESGRAHLFGSDANKLSEVEVINQSTAMVSDISGIASDWLFSLKPYLLVSMDAPAVEFGIRYPLAQGGLILDRVDKDSICKALSELFGADLLLMAREKLRNYYFEGAADKDLDVRFIKSIRETIE
jgi:hypothetical protein